MKTTFTQIVLGLSLILGIFGCAKNDNNNNNNNRYTYVNGACYDSTTGAYVAANLCGGAVSGYNSGYYMSNGSCISSTTGQAAPITYCQNGATSGYGNQCYGQYIYTQSGAMQYVQCAGANCRGYTLVQPSTGTTVYCQ